VFSEGITVVSRKRIAPITLVVAFIAVIVVATVTQIFTALPMELIVPTAVALEVVFLTQMIEQIRINRESLRRFGSLLLQVHDEMSNHLEIIEQQRSLLDSDSEKERGESRIISFAFIGNFLDISWSQFMNMGGLAWLFESIPFQIGANLHRYYYAVNRFNEEVGRRERIIEAFRSDHWDIESVKSAVKELHMNVRAIEGRMNSLLDYMGRILSHLYSELYYFLLDCGLTPGHYLWGEEGDDAELTFLRSKARTGEKEYHEWRMKYGLPPEPPEGEIRLHPDNIKDG